MKNRRMINRQMILRFRQNGLGLATAIFVITVMALLAVLINQLVQNNAETTAEELQLIRSFYAAESGVQFGMNDVFPPDGVASDFSASRCDGAGSPINYPAFAVDGMNACTASVTCAPLSVSAVTYYTITSTGSCGDVSRTIQVRAQ